MNKKLFMTIFLLIGRVSAQDLDLEPTKIFTKIHLGGESIILNHAPPGIQVQLQDPRLLETIKKMNPEEEALVEGQIIYKNKQTTSELAQYHPVFIIQSIKPVSLNKLGQGTNSPLRDDDLNPTHTSTYSPTLIPLSTEAASAITMTTSILLLQSLAATGNEPQTAQRINTAIILSAGAMATALFIYDQLKGKKND